MLRSFTSSARVHRRLPTPLRRWTRRTGSRTILATALMWFWAGALSPSVAVSQTFATVDVQMHRETIRAVLLGGGSSTYRLLTSEGALRDVPKADVKIVHRDEAFEPMSATALRNRLQSEFGRHYEVVATQNFLVVVPRGSSRRWTDLFEQSHRGFLSYVRARGVRPRQGRFPMVAVVYRDTQSFTRHLAESGLPTSGSIAGLYSIGSNRVATTQRLPAGETIKTIRHEAAHQSAYNVGVHSRMNDTPDWIAEGLASMFEPSAMTDARGATRRSDRINRDAIETIKSIDVATTARIVRELIRDDARFGDRRRVATAYDVSWAMMFYLGERMPERFAAILRRTAGRPWDEAYTARQRQQDFSAIIDSDVDRFAASMHRWITSL